MILAYIYDFLSSLFESGVKDDVKRVILYGAAAEEKAGGEGEAKLFIETWNPHKAAAVERVAQERLGTFEERAARLWGTRGIKNRISVSAGNLESAQWAGIKEEVLSAGVTLYGHAGARHGAAEHKTIITFSLSKLRQKDKMKLIRRLYGYQLKKGGKKYKIQGILEGCGGTKLPSNSILVPAEKAKDMMDMLSQFKLSPEAKEAWM